MASNINGGITSDKTESHPMTLVDFIRIFTLNKKYIIIFTIAIGLITAFIVWFVMDPIFLSTSTVKTSSKQSSITGLISEGMPDFSDLGNLGAGSSGKDMALYENILLSRRALEETIIKFKLNDEWELKYIEDQLKLFRENVMEIKKDKLAGTMDIGIYDKNPRRAKEINEFLIDQLNKINIELNVQNARNNREFIEKRYLSAKEDLKNAEDSIKTYQDKYGLAPDLMTKAAAQVAIQLEAEIKSEEVKLELLNKVLSPEQSEVKTQQSKISALKSQLDNMKNSEDFNDMLTIKGKPGIVLNYLRLTRNIEIQTKIITFLLPLYEQAKIEEKKEMPSVIILDQPNFPQKKAKPKRMIMTLIFTTVGFLFSFSYFLFREKWKYFKINNYNIEDSKI